MGTTLNAALVDHDTAYIASVGDSRAYWIENGSIRQITEDHSLVAKLVAVGKLTREEARNHPKSNLLYRTIGSDQAVKVDTFKTGLKRNCSLLLCTDGLWGEVPDQEMYNVCSSEKNVKSACVRLIRLTKENGGKGLPKKTFKDKMKIGKGSDEIDLFYFGRGHTNGDAWVVFPALRVMHAGDIFSGKNIPLLDAVNGGSGVEIGKSLAKAANSVKNVDTIITGHSTTMTMADLREYVRVVRALLAGETGVAHDDAPAPWIRATPCISSASIPA